MLKNIMRSIAHTLLLTLFILFTNPVKSEASLSMQDNTSEHKVVLLTGAAGFIGSNFLKYMFDKYEHYHFIVLDCLTYAGNLDNISSEIHHSPRFKFVYGSVINQDLVNCLMEQAHFVVHFAAESHVARSIYQSSHFFETDVIGTRVLLDSLMRCKNVERFIHISTSEVCGTAERIPMDEDHPLKPRSPYAAAKAGADLLVSAYQCTYDIPTVIVRPFNNYGPNQHLEKMIPRFITTALQNKPIAIHGNGLQTRDWLHTTDTCRALDKILHHPQFSKIKNQTIHIGSGKETSVLTIAQTILKLFNLPEDRCVFVADRPGQVASHNSSTKKSKELLDWEPTIAVEEGLKSVVEWYKNHAEWWKKRENMQHVPISLKGDTVEWQ